MAAAGGPSSSPTLTIGGKDSYLSSSSLFPVAAKSSALKLDSSAIERLSSTHPLSSAPLPSPNPNPKFLTPEETRASLVVLVNKLLRTGSGVRPLLPQLILQTLNQGFPSQSQTLDLGSVSGFLHSLFKLNDTDVDNSAVTEAELAVLANSFSGLEGICAILEHSSAALSGVADAVASLSCEAFGADVSAVVKLTDSGDGLSNKDELGVASDMRVVLVGSKLVGKVKSDVVSEIPQVHGRLRASVRSLHGEMRSVLNSVARSGKTLVPGVLSLALVLLAVGKSSLGRVNLCCDSIADADLRSNVVELFRGNELTVGGLEDLFRRAVSAVEVDCTAFFHEVYCLLLKVREVITWEATLALLLLITIEASDKPKQAAATPSKVEANGGNVNPQKRSEKKKKATLGKGTALIMQLLKDALEIDGGEPWNNPQILVERTKDLSLYFDPRESRLDNFLMTLKDIVESNETRRLPKLPKGTRDFAKEQMTIREKAFSIIQNVFKRHGATALDTPAFELRETLMGKYGEDSKLIYDLADQGGELCSLRYDLTVPFARFVAMNGLSSFKRYQIAKVYRRDNPSKGRYREFYQCDFDISGQYEAMSPDFEVVKVLTELLDELKIGDYEVKLNHRKLLDGMLEICGVPAEKFRTICSSIDKLDKQSFDQVKKEMVDEKGIPVEVADRIGNLVKKKGPPLEILTDLKKAGSQFLENKGSVAALNDLEILFNALEKSKCIHRVTFDLSLARGLDYYTGVIFEAVFKGTTQVGSIAAGGRYDNLIGMFGTKQVAAVGVSLGIERVFTIMEQLMKDQNQAVRATETQVLVGILGDDLSQAAELVSELWNANLKAEYKMHKNPMKLITWAKDSNIPWLVIMGEKERNEGIVKLKNIEAKEEVEIKRELIVEELKLRVNSE